MIWSYSPGRPHLTIASAEQGTFKRLATVRWRHRRRVLRHLSPNIALSPNASSSPVLWMTSEKLFCDSLQSTCCLSHPFTAVPCCAHLRLWRGSHPPDWPPAGKHDSNLTIQQLRSVLVRFLQVQALSWSKESKTSCTAPPCKTCERLSCTEKGVAKRMNKNEKTYFLSFLMFFKFFASSFASCTVAA